MINPITNNPTSILSENMNTIIVAIPPKIKDKMKRVDSILIFFAVRTVMTFCVPINATINAKLAIAIKKCNSPYSSTSI